MKIIIGADIIPTEKNVELFNKADIKTLVGEKIITELKAADYRIFNIEGPLTDTSRSILKNGPVLKVPESTINGIKALEPDLLVLSNNHIKDYGEEGIRRTKAIIEKASIPYIGVGRNHEERSRYHCFSNNGITVGIYNCCEHEFSVSSDGKLGANPYDPLTTFDDIAEAKQKCDFVVVLYHGGTERMRIPSPYLQRIFRKMADCGADIVIAQHTHCIGCYERYGASTLIYGQGNFIFDSIDDEFFANGLLVNCTFYDNGQYSCGFFPIIKDGCVVRAATENEKEEILYKFQERSELIKSDEYIHKSYEEYVGQRINEYMTVLHGRCFMEKIIRKLFKKKYPSLIMKKYYSIKYLLTIYNFLTCEAHYELINAGLKHIIEERADQ